MSSLTPGPTVAVPSISTIATYTVSFIAGPGLKFERAGVVIIKAHTPGANRKIVLILDRYIAVHLTRTIFLILYNPT
jgi:hypothetical protein